MATRRASLTQAQLTAELQAALERAKLEVAELQAQLTRKDQEFDALLELFVEQQRKQKAARAAPAQARAEALSMRDFGVPDIVQRVRIAALCCANGIGWPKARVLVRAYDHLAQRRKPGTVEVRAKVLESLRADVPDLWSGKGADRQLRKLLDRGRIFQILKKDN